jgi:hypothetical protein
MYELKLSALYMYELKLSALYMYELKFNYRLAIHICFKHFIL